MPKKNLTNASYYGHEGVVTDARDNLHEVNPLVGLDGEDSDGLVQEEVGELEESTAPGLGGPINPVTEPDSAPDLDEAGDDEGKKDGDHWDVAHPKPDNEVPGWDEPSKDDEGDTPKKSVPAKKTTPAAKK